MGHVLKGKSVLVTGGAGCIGAWVVKGLRDIGARPIVYDMSGNRRRLDLIMERAKDVDWIKGCLLYTSPSPRDATLSRMPSSA